MQFTYFMIQFLSPPGFLPIAIGGLLFFGLLAWVLAWKGLALWRAARLGHRGWFVALLVINTLGILEILYIYIFSRKPKPIEEFREGP